MTIESQLADDLRLPSFSTHFCRGSLPIAWVFSVSGTKEYLGGRPVAGLTGANLEQALRDYLCPGLPNIFSSRHRYDYRITNAFDAPISKRLGHNMTEAPQNAILAPRNIERIQREVEGCWLILLCGQNAQLLKNAFPGHAVALAGHTGMMGLANARETRLPAEWKGEPILARKNERLRLWANAIIMQLREPTKA
jgi:hypothetical protein